MINKKIIQAISVKAGLAKETTEMVIREYLKNINSPSEGNENIRGEDIVSALTIVINSATEIIEQILQGENPGPVKIPESVTEDFLFDFTENINNGIILYKNITDYIEKLASGNLDTNPPQGKTKILWAMKKLQEELKQLVKTAEYMAAENISGHFNNINSLSAAFHFIATHLDKSFDKINSQKRELEKANEALIRANTMEARDMDMAVTVQRSLMPDSPPRSSKWEIAYFFKPMAGVSGDFYDFYMDNDELSGVSLFDVSGHGISSALISMIAKWIIYQSFHKFFNKSFSNVPLEISRELNSAIGKSDYYLTGVIIKFEDDLIRYINASHPDIYIKKNDTVFPLRKSTGEQPAGMLFGMNIEPVVYDEISYNIEPGDFILLYTDGFSECCNLTGADYGAVKLQKSFSESPSTATAQETLNFLMDNIYKFMGKETFDDDCTVIVIKKHH